MPRTVLLSPEVLSPVVPTRGRSHTLFGDIVAEDELPEVGVLDLLDVDPSGSMLVAAHDAAEGPPPMEMWTAYELFTAAGGDPDEATSAVPVRRVLELILKRQSDSGLPAIRKRPERALWANTIADLGMSRRVTYDALYDAVAGIEAVPEWALDGERGKRRRTVQRLRASSRSFSNFSLSYLPAPVLRAFGMSKSQEAKVRLSMDQRLATVMERHNQQLSRYTVRGVMLSGLPVELSHLLRLDYRLLCRMAIHVRFSDPWTRCIRRAADFLELAATLGAEEDRRLSFERTITPVDEQAPTTCSVAVQTSRPATPKSPRKPAPPPRASRHAARANARPAPPKPPARYLAHVSDDETIAAIYSRAALRHGIAQRSARRNLVR